jgi:hypothetical protein
MKKRMFTDENVAPTEVLLRKQMGTAIDYYMNVMSMSGHYRKQWQFSRGNGWILKVDDMHNVLYYLSLFDDGIEISLTVRDTERAEFLKKNEFEGLYPQIESATKYSDGYALRFGIESSPECQSVIGFLEGLMKMRSAALPHKSNQRTVKAKI